MQIHKNLSEKSKEMYELTFNFIHNFTAAFKRDI